MRKSVAKPQERLRDSKPAPDSAITLRLTDRAFNRFQFGAVSALVVLAIVHVLIHRVFGEGLLNSLTAVFDPVDEASITTVFSMLNLLIASSLLFVIYLNAKTRHEPGSRYWLILSVVFLALSVDEVAQVHERAGNLLAERGLFTSADDFNPDYVVTGLFALVVFVVLIPLLRQLDRKTLVLFLGAGGLFVGGALGMELVELALLRGDTAEGDAILDARSIVEEAGEMYGVALFNFALFKLLPQRRLSLTR